MRPGDRARAAVTSNARPGSEPLRQAEAAIALAVGALMTLASKPTLRVFGVAGRDVTGAAELGWRLFGVRTVAVAIAALEGSDEARSAFLPIQIADQAVFAHARRTGAVPPRASALAMLTSGAIIALDLAARRRERPGPSAG